MPANTIRIIGGQWRGRRLRFPDAPALRPTPDRVRETLFNWLGQDLTGRITLDPFAGSGALSLEALSRGARLAVAVDRDPQVVRALETIAAKLGTQALETHCADARAFLAQDARAYDVIFLDPPFSENGWTQLLPAAAARLAKGGMLYVEAPVPIAAPEGMTMWRHDKAGQVHYHLLRHAGGG
ncbi:MAG TPA: 16S rRNA (guanine(966)-N(2))-methyltransferase RsmD [Casimicrobiaceae bacterium]